MRLHSIYALSAHVLAKDTRSQCRAGASLETRMGMVAFEKAAMAGACACSGFPWCSCFPYCLQIKPCTFWATEYSSSVGRADDFNGRFLLMTADPRSRRWSSGQRKSTGIWLVRKSPLKTTSQAPNFGLGKTG